MSVALSVSVELAGELQHAVQRWPQSRAGRLEMDVRERMLLRPSNGVIEASDYLSPKHDWLQLADELTEPLRRAVYHPRPIAEYDEQTICEDFSDHELPRRGGDSPPIHRVRSRSRPPGPAQVPVYAVPVSSSPLVYSPPRP